MTSRAKRVKKREFVYAYKKDTSNMCAICLDNINQNEYDNCTVLSCEHIFHSSCWHTYNLSTVRPFPDNSSEIAQYCTDVYVTLHSGANCPLCRKRSPLFHKLVERYVIHEDAKLNSQYAMTDAGQLINNINKI